MQTRNSYTLCQWELHTIPAPPRLVWSVQHVDTLFTRPVDVLVACFHPVYAVSSTCAAEVNADHAGIDASEPLLWTVAVIVEYAHFYPGDFNVEWCQWCWQHRLGRCQGIKSLPPLAPSMTPTRMQTKGTRLATAPCHSVLACMLRSDRYLFRCGFKPASAQSRHHNTTSSSKPHCVPPPPPMVPWCPPRSCSHSSSFLL